MITLDSFKLEESVDLSGFHSIESVNETYAFSMFGFLNESHKEYHLATRELYFSLTEARTYEVINESFGDFMDKVKEIIKKFIAFIKSLVERFITALNRLIHREKYILDHEDDFRNFTVTDEFEIDGYNFTIEPGIPILSAQSEFDEEHMKLDLSEFISDANKKAGKDQDALKKLVSTSIDEIKDNLEEDMDKFRATILGRNGESIFESDFSNELFMEFRDGYDTKSKITVDYDMVNDALNTLKNYKEAEKHAKKQRDTVEKEYKKVEKQLEKLISRNRGTENKLASLKITGYDSASENEINVSEDVLSSLNTFARVNIDKVEKMSAAHGMAFSYKLDAIKDRYIQDKKILYNALNRIQRYQSVKSRGDF